MGTGQTQIFEYAIAIEARGLTVVDKLSRYKGHHAQAEQCDQNQVFDRKVAVVQFRSVPASNACSVLNDLVCWSEETRQISYLLALWLSEIIGD